MKICLFKYTENFITEKWKFSDKNGSNEAVLGSTHNLYFWAEIRKNNVYLFKPQFYYIKVGFKGVRII